MDDKFATLIENLHKKYAELMSVSPVTIATLPATTPSGGVYLFSEKGRHLYAGRTKRAIGDRLKDHVSSARDCPFAWRLAREETGFTIPNYAKTGNTRKKLLKDPIFNAAYKRAKERIREMEVRFVGESDPLRQALLEIYVAVVSGAKYNDFDTH